MKLVIDIPAETYKAISEWEKPNTKYAAEYMLYQFVKNGKRIEQTPCADAISRSEAISVASGYCHWSNIPKELAKLPSVNPIPCEDAISRQEVLEGLARIAKAKARSDAQKAMMGRSMLFVERLPSVNTEKTGHWIDTGSGQECSECGEIQYGYDSFRKYCANCGSYNGGGNNGNE